MSIMTQSSDVRWLAPFSCPFPGVSLENAIISDKDHMGARPGGTRCPLDLLSCRMEGVS